MKKSHCMKYSSKHLFRHFCRISAIFRRNVAFGKVSFRRSVFSAKWFSAKCHGPIITGVIQIMLPVLSSESFVYHYIQNFAVVRVYLPLYHVLDDSKITSTCIIFTVVDHILVPQKGFACNGIQMT